MVVFIIKIIQSHQTLIRLKIIILIIQKYLSILNTLIKYLSVFGMVIMQELNQIFLFKHIILSLPLYIQKNYVLIINFYFPC